MTPAAARPANETAGVRERILVAAKTEFAAQGLRGASVRAIASRAGVTAAMINYYFGGKRALYDQVVDDVQGRLLARISETLATGDGSELAARLTGAYFGFLAAEREFPRLLLREVLDRGEALTTFVRRYLAPLRAVFEERFGGGDAAFQSAVSLFGAVAGYFLYEPVLTELLGADAMEAERLERRRQHVMELAALLSRERR